MVLKELDTQQGNLHNSNEKTKLLQAKGRLGGHQRTPNTTSHKRGHSYKELKMQSKRKELYSIQKKIKNTTSSLFSCVSLKASFVVSFFNALYKVKGVALQVGQSLQKG